METVVAVAICLLAVVFLGSLITLIVICHHRYCRRDFFAKHFVDSRLDVNLIGGRHGFDQTHANNMELDDVRLHPDIDKILADTQWVDDATGLIPHCLAILKSSHHLTERLVGTMIKCSFLWSFFVIIFLSINLLFLKFEYFSFMSAAATMSAMTRYQEQEQQQKLWEIIRVAQRISPRVDDVVQSMYPPLDPRLLEARCLSLVLSVSQLAIVIRYLCHVTSPWIGEDLDELDVQMKVN